MLQQENVKSDEKEFRKTIKIKRRSMLLKNIRSHSIGPISTPLASLKINDLSLESLSQDSFDDLPCLKNGNVNNPQDPYRRSSMISSPNEGSSASPSFGGVISPNKAPRINRSSYLLAGFDRNLIKETITEEEPETNVPAVPSPPPSSPASPFQTSSTTQVRKTSMSKLFSSRPLSAALLLAEDAGDELGSGDGSGSILHVELAEAVRPLSVPPPLPSSAVSELKNSKREGGEGSVPPVRRISMKGLLAHSVGVSNALPVPPLPSHVERATEQ